MASTLRRTKDIPPSSTSAFGTDAPSRDPEPAATTRATTGSFVLLFNGSGGQDLVEHHLGTLLGDVLGEGQFGHEDGTGLGEHAFLTG